ncbi:MAG TPA: T9SS type A sorting domain-containing protein [Bacteroidia bacterium]|nr:T9SS type A sorting domain-containing protein [Bacteroidia bacterium]
MNMKKLSFTITILMLASSISVAQFKNNVWCFGDSAGLKFDQGTIQLFNSSTVTTGGSCTISDSAGDLLFYTNTDYYLLWQQGYNALGVVWDRNHNLMQNGDTLIGGLTFQEQVIVPWPDSTHLFYIFTAGVAVPFGFWYSVVDMNHNGGLGSIVQKNVQLNNLKASDCVTAVKHGNGRDWWVFFKDYLTWNNTFHAYLITPSGISGPYDQNIGFATNTNFIHSTFSKDGAKLLQVNYKGLIEVYEFDRCGGLFNNVITIESEQPSSSFPTYFGCEFSASGRFIYVSSNNNVESRIVQFDLMAPIISASKDTIADLSIPPTGGLLKRAPDDKIYFSCVYNDGFLTYPYPDSVTSIYNLNLSVINYPDSSGSACDFSPFSFYLGGNETYWGLPNNPEYDLGALVGSPCDTIVGIQQISNTIPTTLHVYYHPNWEKSFINADKVKGKHYRLRMVDVLGKEVYSESGTLNSQYFTRDLNCDSFTKGMYIVVFETEKEKLTKKFVIE